MLVTFMRWVSVDVLRDHEGNKKIFQLLRIQRQIYTLTLTYPMQCKRIDFQCNGINTPGESLVVMETYTFFQALPGGADDFIIAMEALAYLPQG